MTRQTSFAPSALDIHIYVQWLLRRQLECLLFSLASVILTLAASINACFVFSVRRTKPLFVRNSMVDSVLIIYQLIDLFVLCILSHSEIGVRSRKYLRVPLIVCASLEVPASKNTFVRHSRKCAIKI